MKLKEIVLCILSIGLFDNAEASNYRLIKIEKCTSTNKDIASFDVCKITAPTSIDLTINLVRSIDKAYVSKNDLLGENII